MLAEDYVSFEVAKLLKEKGFNTPCMGRYSVRSKEFHLDCTRMCNNGGLFDCAAPSHQMTKKWLREVHKIFIEVYAERAYNYNDIIFNLEIWDRNLNLIWKDGSFTTYEQACEAAIKYCLENLI